MYVCSSACDGYINMNNINNNSTYELLDNFNVVIQTNSSGIFNGLCGGQCYTINILNNNNCLNVINNICIET